MRNERLKEARDDLYILKDEIDSTRTVKSELVFVQKQMSELQKVCLETSQMSTVFDQEESFGQLWNFEYSIMFNERLRASRHARRSGRE